MFDILFQKELLAVLTFFVALFLSRATVRPKVFPSSASQKKSVIALFVSVIIFGFVIGGLELMSFGSPRIEFDLSTAVQIVAICLFIGLFEETLFRALLYPLIRDAWVGRRKIKADGNLARSTFCIAVAISIVFAVAHVLPAIGEISNTVVLQQAALKIWEAFVFSLVMCALLELCETIWVAVLTHGIFDIFALGPYLSSYGQLPQTYATGLSSETMPLLVGACLLTISAAAVFKKRDLIFG